MPRQRVVVDGESVITQSNKRVASTHLVLAIIYVKKVHVFIYVFSIDVCMLFDCTSLVRV